jgi:hypothetical protein
MKFTTQAAVAALLISSVAARCPNGCSGNGECGTNSQCECHRNFMGADCSERICYYSYAFVDTPLGDINADGIIDMQINKDERTKNFATEAYDRMYGVARPIETHSGAVVDLDGDGLAYNEAKQSGRWDEAHFYRECSNKGICNRATGQCDCFPGYEGEGCQRTSCPGAESGSPCSGHGLCLSAYVDYSDSEYNLWDAEKTMKCKCDAGYDGPDCSLRLCPVGPDPVEHADKVTTSLQKISWGAFELDATTSRSSHAGAFNGPLYFTLTAEDDFGDSWTTKSLSIDYESVHDTGNSIIYSQPVPSSSFLGGAGGDIYDFYLHTNVADDVNASLRALPNNAVSDAYVWMQYHNLADASTNGWWQVGAPEWKIGTEAPNFAGEEALRYPFSTDSTVSTAFQPESGSGITKYWESSGTRFPDFTNSEFAECGQAMQSDTAASTDFAAEGLCIFVSTSNKVTTNFVVTYNTNPTITVDDGTNYLAETMTGYSSSIERTAVATGRAVDGDLVPGFTIVDQGTLIEGTGIPVVTVEEVGAHRYWDVNIDGYPKMSYTGFNTDECSRRGLCDYETGECQCFSGYTGVSCSSQNSISFS